MDRQAKIEFLKKLQSGQATREDKINFLKQKSQINTVTEPVDTSEQERKMEKVKASLEQAKQENPEMLDESGSLKPVEVGAGVGEKAAAFATGLGRSASLGFSDELAGAGSAIEAALEGRNISEGYTQGRDEQRAAEEQVTSAAPGYALAGDIAGSVGAGIGSSATSLGQKALSKGIPGMMGLAAGEGAVAGLGKSEAEDTAGLALDVTKEAALNAGTAGALGTLSKLGGKVVDAFRPGSNITKQLKNEEAIKESLRKAYNKTSPEISKAVDTDLPKELYEAGGVGAAKQSINKVTKEGIDVEKSLLGKRLTEKMNKEIGGLKDQAVSLYKKAEEGLKGVQPAEISFEISEEAVSKIPTLKKVTKLVTEARAAPDRATQARILREAKQTLYDFSRQGGANDAANAGVDLRSLISDVSSAHKSLDPSISAGDAFYTRAMRGAEELGTLSTKKKGGVSIDTVKGVQEFDRSKEALQGAGLPQSLEELAAARSRASGLRMEGAEPSQEAIGRYLQDLPQQESTRAASFLENKPAIEELAKRSPQGDLDPQVLQASKDVPLLGGILRAGEELFTNLPQGLRKQIQDNPAQAFRTLGQIQSDLAARRAAGEFVPDLEIKRIDNLRNILASSLGITTGTQSYVDQQN